MYSKSIIACKVLSINPFLAQVFRDRPGDLSIAPPQFRIPWARHTHIIIIQTPASSCHPSLARPLGYQWPSSSLRPRRTADFSWVWGIGSASLMQSIRGKLHSVRVNATRLWIVWGFSLEHVGKWRFLGGATYSRRILSKSRMAALLLRPPLCIWFSTRFYMLPPCGPECVCRSLANDYQSCCRGQPEPQPLLLTKYHWPLGGWRGLVFPLPPYIIAFYMRWTYAREVLDWLHPSHCPHGEGVQVAPAPLKSRVHLDPMSESFQASDSCSRRLYAQRLAPGSFSSSGLRTSQRWGGAPPILPTSCCFWAGPCVSVDGWLNVPYNSSSNGLGNV